MNGLFYGSFYGGGLWYWALIIVSMVLGLSAQLYISKTYKRWSAVDAKTPHTGAQIAQRMLDSQGVYGVDIQGIAGELTDNYDPRTRVLNLSEHNLRGGSVASIAVACHEAGHAIQHAKSYLPLKLRSALVPTVQFVSSAWVLILMAGLFMDIAGLVNLAIMLYVAIVVFQVVTLPVEFNASRRAYNYIRSSSSGLSPLVAKGARKVLIAAALTYVAAALISVLELLYLLKSRSDD